MLTWLIIFLFAVAFGGVAWFFLAGVKIKSGWQNGQSPLARWLDAKRRERFNTQLPEALATMSNALRAGFSISQAFDSVVDQGDKPMCEEFAILQQQLRIGMSFESALQSMSERVGSDDLTLVTTALLISRKTGGNVTEIFDKISETIRGRMKIERKVKTLTAQGRMQGILVSLMPLILGVAMVMLKPEMMIPFLCSFTGVVSVLVVIALIVLGWFFIRKITKIDV
ncbi:MAG: type II secretion system F family protein [Kiritimatiellae bacterium]|nr:type II secretion system F family protein [Kiritimatiellia bacterium]MBR5457181.1 type II secretion system F family protein [Kiritimatiellia bacterium]